MEKDCLTVNIAPIVIKPQILIQIYILLLSYIILINSQQHVTTTLDQSHRLDIESPVINILIPNVEICQQISTNNCKNSIDHMLKCQQIIFNDPGFSYQQYRENIDVHRQILAQYQTMCEYTQNDYLPNDLYDLKKITLV